MNVGDVIGLWPYFVAGLLGVVCHWLKTMMSLRQGGDSHIHLWHYLRDHSYQSLLTVIMALAGIGILGEANQLTFAAAFGMGYMSDSATDLVGGRVQKVYG